MKQLHKILINKNIFENFTSDYLEVYYNDHEKVVISCENDLKLLEDLENENVLNKENIIKNGLAILTPKFYNYLGKYMVYQNLSAYYKIFNSKSKEYIVVFGFGEVQPGRNIAYVSGIWEVDETIGIY